jgi:hypothetical protein
MTNDIGRLPSAPGFRASHGAAEEASPPKASIPSAGPLLSLWTDQRQRQVRWEVDNGPVLLTYPMVMKPTEIDELEQVLALAVSVMRRTASAIETRSDATGTGAAEGESAVPQGDAKEQSA